MELERGDKTDDSFGDEYGGLGAHKCGIDRSVWKLVQTPSWTHDFRIPDKARQCLWLYAFCDKVAETEHSPGLQ